MSPSAIMKARALVIIGVVYIHTAPGLGLDTTLFNMPLSFFLGGLVISPQRPVGRVARFILVDLLLYAVAATFLYMLVAAALEPLGLSFRRFTDFSIERFTIDLLRQSSLHVGFALTCWFLIAYAGGLVIAETAVRLNGGPGQSLFLSFLAAALFIIGVAALAPRFTLGGDHWYFNIAAQMLVAGALMLAGYVAMRSTLLARLAERPWLIVVTGLLFWYLTHLNQPDPMAISVSRYPSGWLWTAIYAALGIVGALQLAVLLDRVPAFAFLDRLGRASKHVMIHHLFVFTLLNLCFLGLGLMPFDDLRGVFSRYEVAVTWPLYIALGLGVPWLGFELYGRMKARRAVVPSPERGVR